ncbi:MAG: hypothetical protein AAGD25_25095 [Cyanobacteria bacterium P01_F01_bin.150]
MATSSSSSSSSISSSLVSGVGTSLLSAATEVVAAGADIVATQLADELAQAEDEEYEAFEAAAQSQAELLYAQQFGTDERLVKAALIPRTGETAPTIQFMFNPTDLQFSRSVSIEMVNGARTFRGLPKVNFGFVEPYELKLSGLVFDTYESGADVYELIAPLRAAVDFSSFQDPFEEQTITDENGNTHTYSERTQDANDFLSVMTDSALSNISLGGFTASIDVAGFSEYGTDFSTQALEMRRPPVYYFIWGEHNYMRCMIKDLSFKLTMFLPNGRPVRAMVDLSLQEVDLGVASHSLSERKQIVDLSYSS